VECLLIKEAEKYSDPLFRENKLLREAKRYREDEVINKAKANFRGQRKRLIDQRQQPSWAHEDEMIDIYIQSAMKTKETGSSYVVDHEIPLKGRVKGKWVVSGLHVETNLKIKPHSENARKSFKEWPDMPNYD
jgi:hypothetical protein